MINFRGTTFIDEGSSDFILITGVSVLQRAGRSGVGFRNNNRGKFFQPSGIYSLLADRDISYWSRLHVSLFVI